MASFTVLARNQAGYKIPRRMLLPTKGYGGLGPVWAKAFNRTTRRVIREDLQAKASYAGEGI